MAHRLTRATRARSVALVVLLGAAWLVAVAPSASAACHVAAFVETEAEASESEGTVSLVVELQGRVDSCAGTVDVATVDGTAVAGEDYEAVERTLTFVEGDDRVETVDVTILADDQAEDPEVFTVELSDPTDSISSTGGPATVRVTDDGSTATDGTGEPTATDGTSDPTGTDGASDPTATDGATPAGEPAGAGGSGIDLAVLLAVLVAIGIGAFVLLRGRDT